MSNDEQALFSAVDALLEQVAQDPLPPPAERKRLREAAGLSQDQIAKALQARRESVGNWEAGRSEPRPPKRAAYARLLEGLAARFPYPAAAATAPTSWYGQTSTPALGIPSPPAPTAVDASVPEAPAAVKTPPRPAADTKPSASSRRPGAKKAVEKPAPARAAADPRFENGPRAVLDVEDG
ncbi:helix-turn-helix transcriptional regulator [Streptomyces sp. NPDC058613]|uniref:helix-turn-helix transcriptional regulator n=1 Tax=unclassified Streptomyces TaxID=2593676 RepID=UPI003656917F